MSYVLDNSSAQAPASRLPTMPHEVSVEGLRLILLPPGRVNMRVEHEAHLIDVNLNAGLHEIAVGSDRLQNEVISADSIGLWPRQAELRLRTSNTLPGCTLEVDRPTMANWLEMAELRPDVLERYHPYRRDPVVANLGRAAIEWLARDASGDAPLDRLAIEAMALAIGTRALTRLAAADGKPWSWIEGEHDPAAKARVARAVDLAEAQISDPDLSITSMAGAAGLSPSRFATVFRCVLGESPYQFVLRRRTEHAVDLLRGTAMPLAEIAYAVGFSSQAHMNTTLKRLLGTTPGALRRRR